jgi:hypothetical protein
MLLRPDHCQHHVHEHPLHIRPQSPDADDSRGRPCMYPPPHMTHVDDSRGRVGRATTHNRSLLPL